MTEHWKTEDFSVVKENILPAAIKEMQSVENSEALLVKRHTAISFKKTDCTEFTGRGSYMMLDFGKELCGGLRIITRSAKNLTTFRITFGQGKYAGESM